MGRRGLEGHKFVSTLSINDKNILLSNPSQHDWLHLSLYPYDLDQQQHLELLEQYRI